MHQHENSNMEIIMRALICISAAICIFSCKHNNDRLDDTQENKHNIRVDSIADAELSRLTGSMESYSIDGVSDSLWLLMNHSKEKYYIDTASMNVVFQGEDYQSKIIINHRLGTFYGINEGEFGGRLAFTRSNGLNTTLLDENVWAIIPFGDSIVVLTGLSHLGLDRGSAYILKQVGDAFDVYYDIQLGGAPEANYRYRDTIFIATSTSVEAVYDKKSNVLINQMRWGILYPASIYVNSKYVFVGARGCLFVVNKLTKEAMLYRKNTSTAAE